MSEPDIIIVILKWLGVGLIAATIYAIVVGLLQENFWDSRGP